MTSRRWDSQTHVLSYVQTIYDTLALQQGPMRESSGGGA